jgi:hypothetical protein
MIIKNYKLTCRETGSVCFHAGISPTQLTNGSISAEKIANGYYTPPMEWSPNPAQWVVEEQLPQQQNRPARK